MSWKIFALLESSFCVLESVVTIILLLFVMTATSGNGTTEPVAIGGLVAAATLMLVAHGQLISSFRRLPPGEVSAARPGGLVIPLMAIATVAISLALVALGGRSGWADFARVYTAYAIAPPTVLALVSRVVVMVLTRPMSSDPLG